MAEVDLNLLAKVSEDRALASALLFEHRHPQPSCPAHIDMIDAWRAADEFVLIEAFREFGKSTDAEEFLTLEGCFGNFNYGLLIGETYEKACQRLLAIDYECRTNVRLHRLFGGEVLARKSTENKVWFRSGALLEAHGWDQELQSFKHLTHRPDRAYLDDPENLERVRDKESVDASMRKLYLEVIPALDKRRRKIRITQTRRAADCMVTRLATDPRWVYKRIPICDRDPDDPHAVATWPERYPLEWIRNEKHTFESQGMLREFNQAYMLETTDLSARPFRVDQLQAVDASPFQWAPKIAIYDPARTSNAERTKGNAQSNRYGKVVVSRIGSRIFVHESRGSYWKPNEMIEDLFSVKQRLSPAKIAIEKDSLDEWLMQPIRLEILRRGEPLPIVAVNAPRDQSKEDFIMALQPFIAAGDIVLVGGRLAHPHLVSEIENYPEGQRDVLNALAYAPRMFAGEPVYPEFSGANIGEAPDPQLGETVYVAFNGNASDVVAAALIRDGQRFTVARDWSGIGREGVASIVFELRATWPKAQFQVWAPAEVHDQWQRVPLVSQLRQEHVNVQRAEHIGPSRGILTKRLRTEWRGKRMFIVDRRAKGTLNALSLGYSHDVEKGGRVAREPSQGRDRLLMEAIEAMMAMLDKSLEATGIPQGANVAVNAQGVPYMTANPKH